MDHVMTTNENMWNRGPEVQS